MGYGSVVIVIGAIIIAGVLLLGMESSTSGADDEVNTYHFDELARDAAVTGMQLTVRKLAVSQAAGSWKDGTLLRFAKTPFRTGAFRTEVIPIDPRLGNNVPARNPVCAACSGDTVDVVARGFNGPGRQTVFARYVREYADGGIPPAFRNVITTDFYLQLRGNVQIRAINSNLNASIHTNGDLVTNGNSFLVEGYGTYTGVELTNQEDNFIPNIDYNGPEPNVFWADSVHIPLIDMAALRAQAATSGAIINTGDGSAFMIDGNTTPTINFSSPGSWPWGAPPYNFNYNCTAGPGNCGTEENPFIIVVEGPLSLSNRIRFQGYGVIAAVGNVYITPLGNSGGPTGQLTPTQETKMMLASLGFIDIAGNAKLTDGPNYATCNPPWQGGVTLYAWQYVRFRGTPCLVGGIVAKETYFEGSGTPKITYASPTETITDPGFEFVIPIGPILVSYSEW